MNASLSKRIDDINEVRRSRDQKELKFTERHIEMLQILREAPEHPDVKYNSIYFQNYFKVPYSAWQVICVSLT